MGTASGSTGIPIHLAGNNRPVAEEVTVPPAKIVGRVPPGLDGWFLRNGPNPRTGWSAHLYDGDGMVHAVRLEDGTARWYRNRYIRTPLYGNPGRSRLDLAFDPATGRVDHRVTTANTHVVAYASRLLALEEGGFPYEITPDLETVGPFTFGGVLRTPMAAHPKACPATGDLLFFGYRLRPPYVVLHRASAAGELVRSEPITVPTATMMHDFAITASRVVFFDSPIVFDAAGAAAGGPPWRWDDHHGARIGVMPRDGGDADVRWFDALPGHLSHTVNAHDDGDRVVLTGTRLPAVHAPGGGTTRSGLPALHRWTVDLGTGTVAEEPLDDAPSEYPRIADDRTGLPHRYAYTTSFAMQAEPERSEVYKHDLGPAGTGGARTTTHRFRRDHTCGEPVFVPRTGGGASAEDDGYLVTFAHDRAAGTSYLAILDAADVTAPPVAAVHLPVRVPAGFHGTWLPSR